MAPTTDAATETAPAETAETETANIFYDEAEAKKAAGEINAKAKPTKSGRPASLARVYSVKFPENFQPTDPFFCVTKSPAQAAQHALTHAGIVFDSVDTPKVVPPAAYLDLLSDEQRNELEKLIKSRKKAESGK